MSDIPSRLNAALDGRYEVLREVGAGGMATVYLARDLRHDREVAVKVLHPELSAVIGSERFLAEIRTTAALQHPHILPLFDSGEADGLLFYVMPYVAGDSLRDRLDREKQLPVEDAVALVGRIAEALDHAHGRGVIHRDIKPANVLLGEEGQPVVADFGIALAVRHSGDRRVTETGMSLGTPDYMSPEQAGGDPDLGPRSDIYALGCVLHELLTGQAPFTGPTPTAVIARILSSAPEPPSAQRKSVPAHVDAVVLRALEKIPADRFATAGEMARALKDPTFRHGAPDSVGAATRGSGVGAWRAVAAVMTVVAALLLALDLTPAPGGSESSTALPRRTTVVLPDGIDLALVGATPLGVGMRAFDISPSGDRLGFVGIEEGEERLFVQDMATGDVVSLPGTESAYAPFWSPDGEWVGFFRGGTLLKAPVRGGAPIPLADVDLPYGGTWLPDGRLVLAILEGDALVAISSDGGPPDTLWTPHLGAGVGESLVFPERIGDAILLSSAGYHLVRVDLASGAEWVLTRTGWVGGDPSRPIDVAPHDLIRGTDPRPLGSTHLLFVSPAGTLMAVRLPEAGGEEPGEPFPVLDDLRSETVWGAGQWDVSADGALFYVQGESALQTSLVLRSPSGTVDTLDVFGRANWGRLDLTPSGNRMHVRRCSPRGECDNQLVELRDGLARSAPIGLDAPLSFRTWYDDERVAYSAFGADDLLTVLIRADNPDARDSIPGYEVLDVTREGEVLARDPADRFVLGRTETFPAGVRRTDLPSADTWGAVLRDGGAWIAYTSSFTETGEWQVEIARTTAPWDRIRVSPRGGEEPVWHPDGRLVYREDTQWMAVTVPDGPGAPSPARPLFDGPYVNVLGRSHDIDPEGRHLLVEAPGRTTAGRIEVIAGWVESFIGAGR